MANASIVSLVGNLTALHAHRRKNLSRERSKTLRLDGSISPKGRKIALGVAEAAEKYLIKSEQEGGRDLLMKRRRLSLHLVPFFKNSPLSKISGFDIERYKKNGYLKLLFAAVEQGPKVKAKLTTTIPGTINRELAVLSHLFNKAIEWGWIDRRPPVIKRYQEEQSRVTYLTIEQIKRLIDCAKEDQNSQIYPFIVVGLGTSMRRMEILTISRENVNLSGRRFTFHRPREARARSQLPNN